MYLVFLSSSILSVATGAIGAFNQKNLARWLAYGSTGHMGFVIGCLISHDLAGIAASVIYMIVYKLISTLMFAWILAHLLRISVVGSKTILCVSLSNIHDFGQISMSHANLPAALAFSSGWLALAGMPPWSGFVAKMAVSKRWFTVSKRWFTDREMGSNHHSHREKVPS